MVLLETMAREAKRAGLGGTPDHKGWKDFALELDAVINDRLNLCKEGGTRGVEDA